MYQNLVGGYACGIPKIRHHTMPNYFNLCEVQETLQVAFSIHV